MKKIKEIVDPDCTYQQFIVVNNTMYKITKISKYRSFQYRLFNNAILCNDRLYHMNIVSTQDCTFCENKKKLYYIYYGTVSVYIW